FIGKFKADPALQRFNLKPAIAVLTAAARLPLVLALRLRAALDGFLVWHLGRVQLDVHVELAFELFYSHLDMHLAGTREDDLVSLPVAMGLERRVFLDQTRERLRCFFLVAAGFGSNRKRNNRQRPFGHRE